MSPGHLQTSWELGGVGEGLCPAGSAQPLTQLRLTAKGGKSAQPVEPLGSVRGTDPSTSDGRGVLTINRTWSSPHDSR